MILNMKWISFFLILFFQSNGFTAPVIESWELPNDELLIIQAVATTKKNFVVRKGFDDGVALGQESLFSTNSLSVLCKAVEVSRFHSLWVPLDKRTMVPFEKKRLCNFQY